MSFRTELSGVLSDSYNVGILVFLVIAGYHGMHDEQGGRFGGVRALGQRTSYQDAESGHSLQRFCWGF